MFHLLWLAACADDSGADSEPKSTDADGDGYTADDGDCDDSDANVFPGAAEVWYDGVDQACDGDTGEYDRDLDGSAYDVDCDDEDAAVNPDATESCNGKDDDCDGEIDVGAADGLSSWADADGDGYGDPDAASISCDGTVPEGNVEDASDCDDTDASIHPAGEDACGDGIDQDCDGADSTVESTWYEDQDGDGYGNPDSSQLACLQPEGWVEDGSDCADADADIHPGASEACDDVDQDCDDLVDDGVPTDRWFYDADGDGYGDMDTWLDDCAQPEGYIAEGGDCDDADVSLNPGVTEVCDGVDNDCDRSVDDGVIVTFYDDDDGDGYGPTGTRDEGCELPEGKCLSSGDCDDDDAAINPGAAEICDGEDQDCDGRVDDGVTITYYDDDDADGYGLTATEETDCSLPEGKATSAGDCDDDDATVNPGALEACDSVDNDCDRAVDDHAGCFDTGGAQLHYQMQLEHDGSSVSSASFTAAYIGYFTGSAVCQILYTATGAEATTDCANCDYAFSLSFDAGTSSGDHCADIDMSWIDFAGLEANWGFAQAYPRYLDYGAMVLYNGPSSGSFWSPVFFEYADAYPGASLEWDAYGFAGDRALYGYARFYATYDRY